MKKTKIKNRKIGDIFDSLGRNSKAIFDNNKPTTGKYQI